MWNGGDVTLLRQGGILRQSGKLFLNVKNDV